MKKECPECHSIAFKKNGYTRHGKQNHRCLECGRQFSIDTDAYDIRTIESELDIRHAVHAKERVS